MSKQHRPPQIGVWIKSRRYFHRTPAMTSPKTFAAQWWCWWRAANPAWRVVADSDDLVTEMDGDASWGGVNATGINGLLSVIVSLWWLRAKTPDSNPTIHSWHKAVQDVTWVLQQSIGQREEQDNEEEEPPRKRSVIHCPTLWNPKKLINGLVCVLSSYLLIYPPDYSYMTAYHIIVSYLMNGDLINLRSINHRILIYILTDCGNSVRV